MRRKLSPLEKVYQMAMNHPYNSKKYAFNNSVNLRTAELDLQSSKQSVGIPRRSQQLNTQSNLSVTRHRSSLQEETEKTKSPFTKKQFAKTMGHSDDLFQQARSMSVTPGNQTKRTYMTRREREEAQMK